MSYYVSNPAKALFDNYFSAPVAQRYANSSSTPNTDVYSDEKAYHLELELPGFSKDEIAVAVKDGALTVTAEKKSEEESEGKKYHIRERAFRKYERSFKISDSLDSDSINATHEHGVLKITINKKEKALPKAISIQ